MFLFCFAIIEKELRRRLTSRVEAELAVVEREEPLLRSL